MTAPVAAGVAFTPLGIGKVARCTVFSPRPTDGNPTMVVRLPAWPDDERLGALAAAWNDEETTFVVVDDGRVAVRWFAGPREVPLCGHGALAAAAMLAPLLAPGTMHEVANLAGRLWLAHEHGEALIAFRSPALSELGAADFDFGKPCRRVFDAGRDFLVVLDDEEALVALEPDAEVLGRLPKLGCIATAPCEGATAAFRYFAPRAGIPEDRASGSVLPALVSFWAGDGENDFEFRQRSGWDIRLRAHRKDGRVVVGGEVHELSRDTVAGVPENGNGWASSGTERNDGR